MSGHFFKVGRFPQEMEVSMLFSNKFPVDPCIAHDCSSTGADLVLFPEISFEKEKSYQPSHPPFFTCAYPS